MNSCRLFKIIILPLFLMGYIQLHAKAQTNSIENKNLKGKKHWVDSIYQSLNQTEKIGQLFMVAAYSGGKDKNDAAIQKLIDNRQIGGVIFMQGTAEAQAAQTNQFQQSAQVPLLIGMDAEWGLGMRLTGVKDFPKQMMIGGSNDTDLMYNIGQAIAEQCYRLGVHVNFAPVVDVNNNPDNPVINFRSFGSDKDLVSRMGIAYMKGMQDHGIMACAKHFPGHGDVSVDSHLDLPIIKKSKEELKNLEFYPFQKLINSGVQSIMIAHLNVPAIDNAAHQPATVSYKIITEILKEEMNFNGLIFTDALNMKGLTKYYPDGETDLLAFMAGNDVLLFSQNVPLAIQKIQKAIQDGKITEKRLEESVKKILAAKYDHGLNEYKEIQVLNATNDLNKNVSKIKEQTSEASLTIAKNSIGILNNINLVHKKIGYIGLNISNKSIFEKELENFALDIDSRYISKNSKTTASALIKHYKDHDYVIVGIHALNRYPGKSGNYGLNSNQINLLQNLSKEKNVIFVLFGNPYLGNKFCDASTLLVTYEDDEFTQKSAALFFQNQTLAKGKLPVSICQ